MGVIRRQSIWGTIITYVGAALGFVTTAFFFPRIFSTEQIGLINIIIAYATILSTFASLGMNQVIGKFFPYFKDKSKNHNGFTFIITIIPFVGFLIIWLIYPFIKHFFIQRSGESYLLSEYITYLIPFIFLILYFNIYETFYKFLYNITFGAFLKEILQRIVILVGIVLFYFSFVSFNSFVNIYLIAYAVPLVVIVLSLIKQNELSLKPKLNYVSKEMRNSMLSMGTFGIISSFAGMVIMNVDKIMIERLLGLDYAGVYSIVFFFGMIIVLPSRPLIKISSAYIAEAWKNTDMQMISDIYKKSSINQFIIGSLILMGIWCNMHNVFRILPPEYHQGKWVIILIGIAYLTDMVTGNSAYILINSKHYKYVTYIVSLLIIVSVVTNYVFIPIWGLTGAAFASLISKIIGNSMLIGSLKIKYKLFPLNYRHVIISLIGSAIYVLNKFIPIYDNYILDIIYRSIIISIVFVGLIYITKVSEDVNETIKNIFRHIFR